MTKEINSRNIRFFGILALVILVGFANAQLPGYNPYFPSQLKQGSWKVLAEIYGSQESNSNVFTNEFVKAVNNSEYLSPELRSQQLEGFEDNSTDGKALTGSVRSIGGGVYINSEKLFYYIGFEHQHVLDSRIDEDLVKLLFYGNQPYAGQTLNMPSSVYSSIYFNQLKGGVGVNLEDNGGVHTISGRLGITGGQNYDYVKLENTSLYTHPDGDYLDATVVAETKLSDTVWAEVYEIRGMGASIDLSYAYYKEKNFYLSFQAKNLGFVSWNKNPYSASIDTTFTFEGINNDTITGDNNEIPDDFSYNSLRRLIFKNPDFSNFSTSLPVILQLTGGKYFADERYYLGLNLLFYPSLEANYKAELFGTWNYKDIFQLTPIFCYSSYKKFNAGLGIGFKLSEHVIVQAGTSYLNSMFSNSAVAGTGGYARLLLAF